MRRKPCFRRVASDRVRVRYSAAIIFSSLSSSSSLLSLPAKGITLEDKQAINKALRNAGHIGRVGDWAEMAATAGLVSIHFVNAAGSVLVAPFGGTQRRMSTAPFCAGIPRPGQGPIVLDFATSVVAEGKVLVSSQGGKKLPDNALIGLDGKMSTDPRLLYGEYTPTGPRKHTEGAGAIRAFGDHKGSGLAFMCEILGGALSVSGIVFQALLRNPLADPYILGVSGGASLGAT